MGKCVPSSLFSMNVGRGAHQGCDQMDLVVALDFPIKIESCSSSTSAEEKLPLMTRRLLEGAGMRVHGHTH